MNTKTTDGFVRQPDNPGATMNTDNRGLQAYKRRKERENEINTMKNEISEIKNLLRELVNKDK